MFTAYTFLPRGASQQTVIGMWLVLSFIINTVYRSNLKAMLIKPRLVLPFSNVEELVESGIPCFAFRGTLLHRNIKVRGVFLPIHYYDIQRLCCAVFRK